MSRFVKELPVRDRGRGAGRPSRPPAARLLHGLVDFLFPDSCIACGEPLDAGVRHLCGPCRRQIVPALRAVALPRTAPADGFERGTGHAFYALPFDGPSRALVHALKYGRRVSTARALLDLAEPALGPLALGGLDAVVPIPLHPVRRRERGFNQAALLARGLSERTSVPVARGLVRVRPTVDQTRLARAGRLANVRGAFTGAPAVVDGARVLLLDDVVTTGATLGEASAELLRAGAALVVCLALAGRGGVSTPARGARNELTGRLGAV